MLEIGGRSVTIGKMSGQPRPFFLFLAGENFLPKWTFYTLPARQSVFYGVSRFCFE
jgi:hypothetical protein